MVLRRWLGTTTGKVLAIAGGIAVIVGAINGVLALKGSLFDGGGTTPVTVTDLTAQPDADLNVTWRSYHERHPDVGNRAKYTSDQLQTVGAVFTFTFVIDGLAGKSGSLGWALIDTANGHPLPVPGWVPRRVAFPVTHDPESQSIDVWVPGPQKTVVVKVRGIVYDDRGVQRGVTTSPKYQFVHP